MAPRNVNQSAAEGIVGDALGMSMDDLGANNEDSLFQADEGDGLDGEGDYEGDGDEGEGDDQFGEVNLDDDGPQQPQQRQQQQPQRKQQQPQNRQQQRPDDLSVTHTQGQDEFAVKFKQDAKGNIVHAQSGKIIANAGREARLFTTLHKERGTLANVRTAAQAMVEDFKGRLTKAVTIGSDLANQLNTLKQQANPAQRYGLSETEFNGAMELASEYQRDKVGAIKKMLTRAVASGIDLSTLGLQPGGFDPSALMQMVRAEIQKGTAPVQHLQQQQTDAQRVQREQEEALETARTELNQFLFNNPDAKQYLPAIQKIYEQPEFQHMSLGEVWTRIQLNLLRNQQNGRQNRPGPNGQQRRSPNPSQQRRLPNGNNRMNGGGGGDDQQAFANEMAPLDQSYESIVKDVMKALR